jgi:hypothetical protein
VNVPKENIFCLPLFIRVCIGQYEKDVELLGKARALNYLVYKSFPNAIKYGFDESIKEWRQCLIDKIK